MQADFKRSACVPLAISTLACQAAVPQLRDEGWSSVSYHFCKLLKSPFFLVTFFGRAQRHAIALR
jgi:hypothetical protein